MAFQQKWSLLVLGQEDKGQLMHQASIRIICNTDQSKTFPQFLISIIFVVLCILLPFSHRESHVYILPYLVVYISSIY